MYPCCIIFKLYCYLTLLYLLKLIIDIKTYLMYNYMISVKFGSKMINDNYFEIDKIYFYTVTSENVTLVEINGDNYVIKTLDNSAVYNVAKSQLI